MALAVLLSIALTNQHAGIIKQEEIDSRGKVFITGLLNVLSKANSIYKTESPIKFFKKFILSVAAELELNAKSYCYSLPISLSENRKAVY